MPAYSTVALDQNMLLQQQQGFVVVVGLEVPNLARNTTEPSTIVQPAAAKTPTTTQIWRRIHEKGPAVKDFLLLKHVDDQPKGRSRPG